MNTQLISKLRELTSAGMSDCKSALEEANNNLEAAVDLIKARGKNIAAANSSKVASEGVVVVYSTADNKSGTVIEINSQTDFSSRSPAFTTFANLVGQRLANSDLTSFKGDLTPFNETVDGKEVNLENLRKEIMATTKENVVVRRWFRQDVYGDNRRVFSYLHSNNKLGVVVAIEGPNKETIESPEFIEFGENVAMQCAAMSPMTVSVDQLPKTEVDRQKAIFETQLKEEGKPEAKWEAIMAGKMKHWQSEMVLEMQESVMVPKSTIKSLADKLNAKILNFSRCMLGEGIEKEQAKDYAQEIAEMTGVKLETVEALEDIRSETISTLN